MRTEGFFAVLGMLLALAACEREPGPSVAQGAANVVLSPSAAAKGGKTVTADLAGYNHTDKTIAGFYVDGQWGGNITPGSGGGSFVCCVSLPNPWREDTKVTVSWEDHELKNHSREVSVVKYDASRISSLNVHFLRDGQIKIFAGMTMLGHLDYPLKGKEADLKLGVPIGIHN